MTSAFNLVTPTEILFGRGHIAQLNDRAAKLGTRALVVHGKTPGRLSAVFESLQSIDIVQALSIEKEPDLKTLVAAIDQGKLRGYKVWCSESAVALSWDSAKVLAAMLPAHTDLISHLEVVGSELPLSAKRLPLILVPTTSGTGAEVTRNAVINIPEAQRKVKSQGQSVTPGPCFDRPCVN